MSMPPDPDLDPVLVARGLFTGLIDDAAVFPPGNAPVAAALTEHRRLRTQQYADLLGPLLIGAGSAASLAEESRTVTTAPEDITDLEIGPVPVGVIARPGVAPEVLLGATSQLRDAVGVEPVSLEVAHEGSGWQLALEAGLPVAVEVPREADAQAWALDEIAVLAERSAVPVRAKLRTQATAAAPAPNAAELAGFIVRSGHRQLPFKVTGGLHHAVAGDYRNPDGLAEHQHGVLNVLAATRIATNGGGAEQVAAALAITNGEQLAKDIRAWPESVISTVRQRFTSFGCCGVLDPITELIHLGLLSS